jgi:hypothetical protein
MRQIPVLILATALAVGACSAAVADSAMPSPSNPEGTPSAEPTAEPTAAPTVEPTSTPTPLPSAAEMSDGALIETAITYANDAGFVLDVDEPPAVVDQEPMFDPTVLHRVSLALADGDDAVLDVYLDGAGAIRVVEDGNYLRPSGAALTEAGIFEAADRHLRQVGIDPSTGTLHVAAHGVGYWYLTFDRAIEGHRVANAPMAWWLFGDKAYLELRADGSLANLYAIRPDAQAAPAILNMDTLNARLGEVAHRSPAELATYDLELLWVRSNRDYPPELTLSLDYCATHTFENGWEAWCVDAGTGEASAFGSGVD